MKLFPEAEGTFTFKDRDKTEYDDRFIEMLKLEFAKLSMVRMTKEELEWSKNIRFIPTFYFEWLNQFRFDFNKIKEKLNTKPIRINGIESVEPKLATGTRAFRNCIGP